VYRGYYVGVQCGSIRKLALLMDVGITELLKDVDMPLLEMVRLVYPEWRMKETSYGNEREERNATSDEEDERRVVSLLAYTKTILPQRIQQALGSFPPP